MTQSDLLLLSNDLLYSTFEQGKAVFFLRARSPETGEYAYGILLVMFVLDDLGHIPNDAEGIEISVPIGVDERMYL